MDEAKRARTAETPKQPCPGLKLRAPYFYPDQGRGQHAPLDVELSFTFFPTPASKLRLLLKQVSIGVSVRQAW